MKPYLTHTAAFLVGAVISGTCVGGYFFSTMVAESMQSWGAPRVLSERDLRDRMAGLGIDAPRDSRDLYLFVSGFQDHSAFAGMTLSTDNPWPAVEHASGFSKSDFQTEITAPWSTPADYGPEFATADWKVDASQEVFVAKRIAPQKGRVAYFHPDTGRLLIADWSN